MSAEHVVLAAYVACLAAVLVFSVSAGHLALGVRRQRARGLTGRPAGDGPGPTYDQPPSGPAPRVTVQLPISNELHVAERVIDAAAALDHPADRLCIQVLDDSTDETTRVIAAATARHQARGSDVVLVRRGRREWSTAGALAHGLAIDPAEFLLVLDTRLVPQRDLITRLLPHFEDRRVGAAQTRWGRLNEHESFLTAVPAFLLGLHFRTQQPGHAAAGGTPGLNGSAGMWRRTAIVDAGGWQAGTGAVDLCHRARERGWRIADLDELVTPSEPPADIGALSGRQHRWIRGGAQNARPHLSAVLGRQVPRNIRWHPIMHVLSGSLFAVILAMLVLSVPLAAVTGTPPAAGYTGWGLPFAGATAALGAILALAHQPSGIGEWVRFAALLPAYLVLTMGLVLHNGLVAISGLFGRPGGDLARTAGSGGAPSRTTRYATRAWDRRAAAEVVVAAWLTVGLVIGLVRGENAFIPLQLMALAGLGWVLTVSLVHPWRARRRARVPAAIVWPPSLQEVAR